MSEQKTVKKETPVKEKKQEVKEIAKESKFIAAIQIRGIVGVDTKIVDTLRMLNMEKRFSCIVIPNNSVNMGMLHKVKDYITYGEINDETLKLLEQKRPKKNNHFALHPPRGGFERKGTKKHFVQKGALGYRGDKINDLIKKML